MDILIKNLTDSDTIVRKKASDDLIRLCEKGETSVIKVYLNIIL